MRATESLLQAYSAEDISAREERLEGFGLRADATVDRLGIVSAELRASARSLEEAANLLDGDARRAILGLATTVRAAAFGSLTIAARGTK